MQLYPRKLSRRLKIEQETVFSLDVDNQFGMTGVWEMMNQEFHDGLGMMV
jgi:hypothetical protein